MTLWMTMSPLRYFLVPADAAWPSGTDRVEDVIGRERRAELAALAAWEVTPQQATAFLDGATTPLPAVSAAVAAVAAVEPELSAVRSVLEHFGRDPEGAMQVLARMITAAGGDVDSLGARWEAELRAAGHGELVEAARRMVARLPRG